MAASLEGNKILAAILTAGIIASGSGVLSRIIYQPHHLAEPVYRVEIAEVEPEEVDPAPDIEPIAVRLAAADADAGQRAFRACAACHTVDQNGAHRVGPALWGVVGRDVASVAGFSFSGALEDIEGEWTFEKIDEFLRDPRGFAPGNRMVFPGVRDHQERANIVEYLRTLADDPEPRPEPD